MSRVNPLLKVPPKPHRAMLSGTVPEATILRLNRFVARSGGNRSRVLEELLEAALDAAGEPKVSPEELAAHITAFNASK
jgi:hypothetical protein